jgi:hypothetical protein
MTDEPKGNLMCGVCGKLYGDGDGHDHTMTDELDELIPCISCGVNAVPVEAINKLRSK